MTTTNATPPATMINDECATCVPVNKSRRRDHVEQIFAKASNDLKAANERKAAKEAKREAAAARRVRVVAYKAERKAEKEAKREAAKHNFPLIGSKVIYRVDTRRVNDTRVASGTIVGLVLDKRVPRYLVVIDTPSGVIRKALRAIVSVEYTPIPGTPSPAEIIDKYLGHEIWMRDSYKPHTDE